MGLVNLQMEYDLFSVPLPNVFIDEYMPYCNPIFAVVYITGLRHCYNKDVDLDSRDLSKILGISEKFVVEAWKHWQSEGLVKILDESDGNFSVEFLAVEHRGGTKKRGKRLQAGETEIREKEETENREEKNNTGSKNETSKTQRKWSDRPNYTVDEITLYTGRNENTKRLFAVAEKAFGDLLSFNDMSVIFGLYDWLGLPVDVVETLLDYCVSNGKKGMRYIEKVAIDWHDNNISTAEEAKDYIGIFNTGYREILKSFGQGRRDPNNKEIAYMKKWLREYKLPLELVNEACERTLAQTGKAQFSYADKILTDWHEKEFKTIDEVLAADEEYKIEKEKERGNEDKSEPKAGRTYNRKGNGKSGKSRFDNFESRDIDFSAIEKMERELLMKKMGGEI